jgi:membrane-bound serine protease (ClpP class)
MRYVLLLLMLCANGFAELAISPEELNKSLEKHIPYNEEGTNYVGHIYVGGHSTQISQGTFIYIRKALDYFRDELKPIFIILELDTPGGQVFAAQRISDALKEMDIQYGIPVVAVINNWAISAGAMLAYSCRYIAAVKDASMGAASPVTQTGEATSEKVNSAIRADFANRAAFFDRNPLIAKAMVDADLILVVRDGKIVELGSDDEIKPTDRVITKKGKLLTLSSEEMMELGVADIRLLPAKLAPITEEEKKKGEWLGSQELLFSYPFFEKIPNTVVKSYKMDWKTQFFTFLGSPIVASILFLGLLLGFYMEMSTPGFGFPGIIALICLGLIILSSFALEAAGWLEFIILGVGIALILIEIFVIPGFGITGIIGIILAVGALFILLLPGIKEVDFDFDTNTLNAAGQYIFERIVWLSSALIIGVIAIVLLAKYFMPRFALFSPLVLKGEQTGYVAGRSKEELPEIGAVGVVVSPLRTAGKVEIEGEYYDAVSSGKFIDKGMKVQVIGIEGSKMIVEETE